MSIQANFPAIKPTLLLDFANTEALDPRITFTRASTGTYYDGKAVAKAEENLLTFSEQFDNAAWSKGSSTITVNSVTAPDGTTTADSVIETATTAVHYLYQGSLVSGSTYAFSVYLKANTRNWAWIYNWSAADRRASFDLQNGVVGTVVGGTASIVSVGSGWYRCTFVSSVAGTGASGFGPANADNTYSYAGDGTSGIYAWGAQLEQRASVTAYTPTTTQPVTNYIPVLLTAASGVPRFEHNPVTGESLGLEIEEQRTNLLTYSEQFDNAAWTKNNATINANTVVAPDGTITADKLVNSIASAMHYLSQGTSIANVTCSVYAKAAELSVLQLAAGVSTEQYVNFNLTTGSVGSSGTSASNISITSVGNGWYRCSVTWTTGTSGSGVFIASVPSVSSLWLPAVSGNGFSGIYIWGAQLEAGAFPTSYIPTVASQVTRAADSAVMTGANFSSWYNPSEGSFYSAFEFQGPTSSRSVFVANDGTASNYITSNTSGMFNFAVTTGGALQAGFTLSVTAGATQKIAGAYRVNDFAASRNGGAVSTDTVGKVPITNSLAIGSYNTFDFLSGTISRIAYYPVRLTNAQLQALTS